MKLTFNCSILKTFVLGLFLIIGAACAREDINPGPKPFVQTNKVTVNTEEGGGITFHGEFVLPATYRSISYGFYLSNDSTFVTKTVFQAGTETSPRQFEATLQSALKTYTRYYVQAWAKTEKYEVLGNTIHFDLAQVPPPSIDQLFPDKGVFGDTIMITGKNFDFENKNNQVYFNDAQATKTWSKTDTIWAIVPIGNPTLPAMTMGVKVLIYGMYSLEPVVFALKTPLITTVSATRGQYPRHDQGHGRKLPVRRYVHPGRWNACRAAQPDKELFRLHRPFPPAGPHRQNRAKKLPD
jgi:hypothetical protein